MTSRPPIKRQQNRSHNNVTIACPVARVINAIITWAEEADGANAYFYILWANTNYSNVIWAVVFVVVFACGNVTFFRITSRRRGSKRAQASLGDDV